MFKYVTDVNVRTTRNADKSKLSLSGRKNLRKYTDNFSYSGGMIWNTIRHLMSEKLSHLQLLNLVLYNGTASSFILVFKLFLTF